MSSEFPAVNFRVIRNQPEADEFARDFVVEMLSGGYGRASQIQELLTAKIKERDANWQNRLEMYAKRAAALEQRIQELMGEETLTGANK